VPVTTGLGDCARDARGRGPVLWGPSCPAGPTVRRPSPADRPHPCFGPSLPG